MAGQQKDPLEQGGFILNQKAYSANLGSFGRRGSMQKNACGPMAAYNAACMLGVPAPFEEVCGYFTAQSRLFQCFGGRLGTGPWAMRRWLIQRGIRATGFRQYRRAAAGHRAYVALYLHGSLWRGTLGAHYVALEYHAGRYLAYNDIFGSYMDFWDMYNKTGAKALWVMALDLPAPGGAEPRPAGK